MTQSASHIDLQHIGTRLRTKREALGLSIHEIAETTNLQPDYLRNIEILNIDALPSIGYVLGFVRSYAGAVGLDGDNAVADYKADVQVPENLGMRDQPHFVPMRKITLPTGFVPALMTLGFAVMFAVWYGVQTESSAASAGEINAYADSSEDELTAAPILDAELVTLRAQAPSWVQVKDVDGTVLVSRIFVAGETWQGPKYNGYRLAVRDAGAIMLFWGEDKRGVLGQRGQALSDILISDNIPSASPLNNAVVVSQP